MAIFPKIYKILENEVKSSAGINEWTYYALVEEGYLVAISSRMILKSKLSLYTDEDSALSAEGKLVHLDTLKEMSKASVEKIECDDMGIWLYHKKQEDPILYKYAGTREENTQNYFMEAYTETKLLRFPNYKDIFLKPMTAIATPFPYIGLNLSTLSVLQEGFRNSIANKKEQHISIKMVESLENGMCPSGALLVEPLPKSEEQEEVAVFMPSSIPHLDELNELL